MTKTTLFKIERSAIFGSDSVSPAWAPAVRRPPARGDPWRRRRPQGTPDPWMTPSPRGKGIVAPLSLDQPSPPLPCPSEKGKKSECCDQPAPLNSRGIDKNCGEILIAPPPRLPPSSPHRHIGFDERRWGALHFRKHSGKSSIRAASHLHRRWILLGPLSKERVRDRVHLLWKRTAFSRWALSSQEYGVPGKAFLEADPTPPPGGWEPGSSFFPAPGPPPPRRASNIIFQPGSRRRKIGEIEGRETSPK